MRATLRLTVACNNHCIFCSQAGVAESARETLPRLREGADELTFVGGEPALVEDLAELLAAARAAGFRAVGVQTNGLGLAERAALWAQAGLTDVHVSLHGAEPAVHDYHTGVDGSFVRLLGGVAAARAAGLRVVAATVLTRSNFRGLDALARLVHQRGLSAWSIVVPEVAGRAAAAFDRVVPRLGLALPFALHAASLARQLGLTVFLDGAPLCLLGRFAPLSLDSRPRAFAPVCQGCAARPRCPGVDARYLARFDGDELAARDAPQEPATSPLQRLFVGAGELASSAPVETPASPAAARRQLPLYGKVTPALHEASAVTPKKSGEALRELFPGLFEKEPS